MKVRITKGLSGYLSAGARDPYRFARGEVVDVSNQMGENLIRTNCAERIREEVKMPKATFTPTETVKKVKVNDDIAEAKAIVPEIKKVDVTKTVVKRRRRV